MTDLPETPAYAGMLLYRARMAARVGQGAAAKVAGCSRTLLALIEAGKRRIDRRRGNFDLWALCRLLGVSEADRLALEEAARSPLPGAGFPRDSRRESLPRKKK